MIVATICHDYTYHGTALIFRVKNIQLFKKLSMIRVFTTRNRIYFILTDFVK